MKIRITLALLLALTMLATPLWAATVRQDLVKAGLVRSQSGPGGGYRLDRDPEEISILDVINAIGSIERIRTCPLGLESHTSLCPLHQELDKAYAAMEEAFARVTVAQVNQQPTRISPLCEVTTSD